jgi:hypothetical protein
MADKGTLELIIDAAQKLDPHTSEWDNVLAFIQSCYAGRVRRYDLDQATESLSRLSESEQHALITWALLLDEAETRARH